MSESPSMVIQMFPPTPQKKVIIGRIVKVVVLKPTNDCNADCNYCYAASTVRFKWTVDLFKEMFDKLEPALAHDCSFIWHGGEPMMLAPSFYAECCDYIKSKLSSPAFMMQSNILNYSTKKWKPLLDKYFDSCISTSYDIVEKDRTIKGDAALYAKRFKKAFKECLDDGLYVGVITVVSKENADTINAFLDFVGEYDNGRGLCSASFLPMEVGGRKKDDGSILTYSEFVDLMIPLMERILRADQSVGISTVSDWILSYLNKFGGACGHNEKCAYYNLILENDGSVTCCEDLKTATNDYVFGNIMRDSLEDLYTSANFIELSSRVYKTPLGCKACKYWSSCKGGCPKSVIMGGGDISSKNPDCESIKRVYKAIEALDDAGRFDFLKGCRH